MISALTVQLFYKEPVPWKKDYVNLSITSEEDSLDDFFQGHSGLTQTGGAEGVALTRLSMKLNIWTRHILSKTCKIVMGAKYLFYNECFMKIAP